MRTIILSTDWWTDCDDAVAIRLLAAAHHQKKIRLLGVNVNAYHPKSVSSILTFMEDCGLSDIPVAIDRDAVDFTGRNTFQVPVAALSNGKFDGYIAEEPISMFRRLLAEADGPVEIIEIGFPHNLAAL